MMHHKIILVVFILTSTFVCNIQIYYNIRIHSDDRLSFEDASFISADSAQLYFPINYLKNGNQGLNSFKNAWYSEQLSAMREPIIFSDQSQKEIYRFTWLRTFHNPIAIRIEKNSDTYSLFWKLCNGAGGYEPGHLILNKQKLINKQTWETFKNKLSELDFWVMPTSEHIMGLDGSQWILEGKNGTQYHVVDRWTPDENNMYFKCCNFLIMLTDLNITGEDKY